MKQFLLDKINTIDLEVLLEFNKSLTNNLPTNPKALSIWGSTDDGFWYLNGDSARFYENSGILHIIDTVTNSAVHKFAKLKYEDTRFDGTIRMFTPLEFEELFLENEFHPMGLLKGQSIYYNKFVSPTGSWGNTHLLDFMLVQSPNTDANVKDQYGKLLSHIGLCEKILQEEKYANLINEFTDAEPSANTHWSMMRDADGYFFITQNPYRAAYNNILEKAVQAALV
jgi:hypothetical protein